LKYQLVISAINYFENLEILKFYKRSNFQIHDLALKIRENLEFIDGK